MANSADPDQLASSEANWSGSTLFAKVGHIRVQQDKGSFHYNITLFISLYMVIINTFHQFSLSYMKFLMTQIYILIYTYVQNTKYHKWNQ